MQLCQKSMRAIETPEPSLQGPLPSGCGPLFSHRLLKQNRTLTMSLGTLFSLLENPAYPSWGQFKVNILTRLLPVHDCGTWYFQPSSGSFSLTLLPLRSMLYSPLTIVLYIASLSKVVCKLNLYAKAGFGIDFGGV